MGPGCTSPSRAGGGEGCVGGLSLESPGPAQAGVDISGAGVLASLTPRRQGGGFRAGLRMPDEAEPWSCHPPLTHACTSTCTLGRPDTRMGWFSWPFSEGS